MGLDIRLLGTRRLTWRRLDAVVQQAGCDPRSALWRATTDHPYLDLNALVMSEHTLRVLAWQQSADGQAKPPKNFPKPITAPQETARPRRIDAFLAAKLAAFEARTREQMEA